MMTCWNCGNDEILPRADGLLDHPKAGRGDYICGRCGAAGDAEDFRFAYADAQEALDPFEEQMDRN